MIKPLGFLPFQTQRWYDAEPWGCNVNTRKSWVSPMASNSIVKLACIYCEPHLEGVVTELGSGWNESLGLHFCVSRHFKKMKGLELEQMLENACILRFHHFIARCPVKTCLFWNEHLFAWLHEGCLPSLHFVDWDSCLVRLPGLVTICNMPIKRYFDYLQKKGTRLGGRSWYRWLFSFSNKWLEGMVGKILGFFWVYCPIDVSSI